MDLFKKKTKRSKRTGMTGAIFAVVGIIHATRTLTTYMRERNKKK